MRSKVFLYPAAVALGTAMTTVPAHADHVFQFSPYVITAPDSRSFANSTVGSPASLAAGTVVLDAAGGQQFNFLDTWQFTLGTSADLIGFVGSINFTTSAQDITFGIKNLQLSLTGPSGRVIGWQSAINFVGFQQMFSIVTQAPFVAGDYNMDVRGLLVGPQSSYAGTLQAVDAVPLPPTWHLLAAGLVFLGWRTQRQRKAG